jgi:hypothetical protein
MEKYQRNSYKGKPMLFYSHNLYCLMQLIVITAVLFGIGQCSTKFGFPSDHGFLNTRGWFK